MFNLNKGIIVKGIGLCWFSFSLQAAGSIAWQSCQNEEFATWFESPPALTLQCAHLTVPLDPANPIAEETIQLALTRLPAIAASQGSLVVITGGPGMPGINPAIDEQGAAKVLRKSFDIIGYDPRGVGHSSPAIACPLAIPLKTVQNELPLQHKAWVEGCVRKMGIKPLKHIGSTEATEDLEQLRQALQVPQLNLLAYSYGTQIAALYAERYPERIRAAVLDGIVDLSQDNFEMRIGQEAGFQQVFDYFAQACRDHPMCPWTGQNTSPIQIFHALLESVVQGEVLSADKQPLEIEAVLMVVYEKLLWQSGWDELILFLNQIRTGSVDAYFTEQVSKIGKGSPEADALLVISCADHARLENSEAQRRIKRLQAFAAAPFVDIAPLEEKPWQEECDFWPYQGALTPHIPQPSPKLPPLLFVAQRFDPTTPYVNAVRMSTYFRSPLVTKEGYGHTLVLSAGDYCVDDEVVDYLLKPDQKRTDRQCP